MPPCVAAQSERAVQAASLDSPPALDSVIPQLAGKRVIFIGETHDRYDHHLNQLEVIRRLHQLDPNMAIGVEYLQQRFQPQVDDYIAGRITENEFLRSAEYFKEWGYDYRLYAPIFRFAREQGIPVRALNVPSSLASDVAKLGVTGLSESQRSLLPREMQPADEGYKARLRAAFEEHASAQKSAQESAKPGAFDRFVEAQLVWDEGMASHAAEYLSANPGRRMVILAGAGHIEFGSGIPTRLERRIHATYAIVLNSGVEIEPHIADYILLSQKEELPSAGILGASLTDKEGECRVASLSPQGGAEKAGIKRGDVLLQVNGQPIKSVADVHLALWEKKPGEHVEVLVRRGHDDRHFDVELAAPPKGPN
ncbi:MAG TPA: ChaN family lipoprotein [Bryobacteraceae bacterium]